VPVVVAGASGAGPDVVVPYLAVVTVVTVFAHADVLVPGSGASRLVVTPAFHRAHHEPERAATNYALVLPIWDVLFRTVSSGGGAPGRSRFGSASGIPAHGLRAQLAWGLPGRANAAAGGQSTADPATSDVRLASPLVASAVNGSTPRHLSAAASPSVTASSVTASAAEAPATSSSTGWTTRNASGCETALTATAMARAEGQAREAHQVRSATYSGTSIATVSVKAAAYSPTPDAGLLPPLPSGPAVAAPGHDDPDEHQGHDDDHHGDEHCVRRGRVVRRDVGEHPHHSRTPVGGVDEHPSACGNTPRGMLVENGMHTIALTDTTFEDTVANNDIVIIDWWASWCGPCRSFAPVFEAAAGRHDDIVFAKVDTEAQPRLAGAAGIMSIPTLMVFREQVLVFSQAGALPEAALEQLIGQVRALDMDELRGTLTGQPVAG
jgi:thioredoxin 1